MDMGSGIHLILTFSAVEVVTNCIIQGFMKFCTIQDFQSKYDLNIFYCLLLGDCISKDKQPKNA